MSGSLEVEYGKLKFCAHLQYSKRKTLSISVLPDCSIVATAPIGADMALIIKTVKKHGRWIKKQIQYFEQFLPRTPAREYISGETHLYLGKKYRLKFVESSELSLKLKGRFFLASGPAMTSKTAQKLMDTWYQEKATYV